MGSDPTRPDVLTPPGQPCRWCGEQHDVPLCPIVKAFGVDPQSGLVVRVEYLTHADFQQKKAEEEPERPYPTLGGG